MKQTIETAVSAGRSVQSPQTGFVHYFYEKRDEVSHDTIPVYENVLFALALFRTKISSSVKEAKDLIEKLLPYQVDGTFPKYLHEFPTCFDPYLSAKLLIPFYWILKRFFLVLGTDLRQRLTETSEKLLQCASKISQEKNLPFQVVIQIAAAKKAFGDLWQQSGLQKEGETLLDTLRKDSLQDDFGTWYSPQYIAETLTALMAVYSSIPESPWNHFWEYVEKTYYRDGFCYTGPAVHVRQWGGEPAITAYDLAMGSLMNQDFPYRSFSDHPIQLQAALLFPEESSLSTPDYPCFFEGSVANHKWIVCQEDYFAYSAIQKKMMLNPSMQKGFHVFRLVWGEVNSTHTFICQGELATQVDFVSRDHFLELEFFLAESVEVDPKESHKEIAFYCDQFEGTEIFVNGEKATTFQFGETINIHSVGLKMDLKFDLVEGDGRFFGHIMPGNRPAQMNLTGKNRFEAFDWSIFLRTVKRYTPCKIKVLVKFQKS